MTNFQKELPKLKSRTKEEQDDLAKLELKQKWFAKQAGSLQKFKDRLKGTQTYWDERINPQKRI